MSPLSTPASKDIVRRYRGYGLFGGVTVGAVVGVLVSGPNFTEWGAAQSLAVIGGFTVTSALIGYFFLAQLYGASAGAGVWYDGQEEEEEENAPARRETTGIGSGGGHDGD